MRGLWLRAPGRWNPETAGTTPPKSSPRGAPPASPGLDQRWDPLGYVAASRHLDPTSGRLRPPPTVSGPAGQECANGAGWALQVPGGSCGL